MNKKGQLIDAWDDPKVQEMWGEQARLNLYNSKLELIEKEILNRIASNIPETIDQNSILTLSHSTLLVIKKWQEGDLLFFQQFGF